MNYAPEILEGLDWAFRRTKPTGQMVCGESSDGGMLEGGFRKNWCREKVIFLHGNGCPRYLDCLTCPEPDCRCGDVKNLVGYMNKRGARSGLLP